MRKRIKILIIFISIIALIFITSCFITKYIFGDTKNTEWMQKWKGIVNFDLKTERKIKEDFIIKFDPE
jgi:predicted permease